MPEKALKSIAGKYHLTAEQAAGIFGLLDQGYSVPYVMRYRKDLSAGMQASDLRGLVAERKRLEKLDSRRRKILKKLKERDVLTDELEQRIHQAANMRELIDYYVPYRPRKRSRSRQALAQGLGSLASEVLSQERSFPVMGEAAESCVDPEAGLDSVEATLEGIFHIITDWVAEEKTHRDRQREVFAEHADIVCSRAGRSLPSRLAREFRPYLDFRSKAADLHPHHMLNILRGKRMGALRYTLTAPIAQMARAAAKLYLPGGASQYDHIMMGLSPEALAGSPEKLKNCSGIEFVAICLRYSLQNILADVTARELDRDLCKQAENLALEAIRRHVRSVLTAPPLPRRMLAIHPGYRTGCNMAALDEKGIRLETCTAYPHAPQCEMEKAKDEISRLIETHGLEVVVIGLATAAEETEALIAGLIEEKFPDLRYTVVSEAGVEAYAESRAARNDLPDVDERERCAVVLGRRLQDPLSELVKMNPRELCPDPYADDVNSGALKRLLDEVLEECVCEAGVDVNQAHPSLLRYMSGLGPEAAVELVSQREKESPFTSREQLRQVPKLDADSYEQAIGFLRVEGSANPLDASRIHPRFYPAAEAICQRMELSLASLATEEGRQAVKERRARINLAELEKEIGVHYLMLQEIMDEMADPWPDARAASPGPLLRKRPITLQSLEQGQWLMGTVRNIVDFGVFVDVGVGEDGLVHISELADSYVEDPHDIVCVGDRIKVRVVSVDIEKKRIALSRRAEGARREHAEAKRPGPRRGPRRAEQHAARKPEAGPGARKPAPASAGPLRTPMSTRGSDSRRVQKASVAEHLARNQTKPVSLKPGESARQAEGEQDDEDRPRKADLSGLLKKIDFAAVERRGKQSQR